ncbi:hypothetical protein [Siccirubricoccus sp. G192]|uniref:hypothetical protein n=1 Tax=Siccirubricoccus sp. G192 TaxID=2849651 RepID=UPI001C2BFBC5|nr:hypothetical protein [Siccirubricoccus sp. G192]
MHQRPDGCPGLRRILLRAGVDGLPILDWFHLGMRLQHLTQIAGGLPPDGPERAAAKAVIVEALTEGTANFLVNRRMAKSQQMRWSRRGADLLLQVRCAVYNGTLGTGLGHRFHAANDMLPRVTVAA